jgi:hypothetical protein
MVLVVEHEETADCHQEKIVPLATWQAGFFAELKECLSGWWYTYPSEKYESQLGLFFSIYGKIKDVPYHQSVNHDK